MTTRAVVAFLLTLAGMDFTPASSSARAEDAAIPPEVPKRVPGLRAVSISKAAHPLGSDLAIDTQGRMFVAWGADRQSKQVMDEGSGGPFADWTAIDRDSTHLCGLRAGRIYCLEHRQADTNSIRLTDLSDVRSFTLGPTNCAILADGTLHCWNSWSNGDTSQVGTATDWEEIDSAGPVCGRRRGKIYCWGDAGTFGGKTKSGRTCTSYKPAECIPQIPVPAFTQFEDWVELAVGNAHVCARRKNGDVHCDGRLFDTPRKQPIIKGASEIGSGPVHSCAVVSGKIWCWGVNDRGQLGVPSGKECPPKTSWNIPNCKPVEVPPPPSGAWTHVAPGEYRTCAIASDGAVFCWGAPWFSE